MIIRTAELTDASGIGVLENEVPSPISSEIIQRYWVDL